MKNLLISLCILIVADLLLSRCANMRAPTGGPRDTIPPVLLNADPNNGATNVKTQEFRLEFSEFVKADKIQQQLIITPKIDNKYKTVAKKNILLLKFEDPFEDSTTYNFNFADAVTDITENNPAINLSLAFSTGSYIDSLGISGSVIDLFKQEEAKGYLVGLYPYTDTLNYFRENPLYFTTSNDSGKFQISYVKAGLYKLLVFKDENRNILLDPETEQHGFIPDSILLYSKITLEKPIPTLLQDVKPITYINARPTGPYIELKYSKTISDYMIEPAFLPHSIVGENKEVLRIYKHEKTVIGDSILLVANVSDSLGNNTLDSIKTAFIESNRKPSAFSYNIKSVNEFLQDNQKFTVTFSKPVLTLDSTKFSYIRDSTFNYQLSPKFEWNQNRTLLTIETLEKRDFLLDTLEKSFIVDTVSTDSLQLKKPPTEKDKLKPIELQIDTAAFISVEKDTSDLRNIKVSLNEPKSFGTIQFVVQTELKSFNVQLLDKSGKAVHSQKNQKEFSFAKVKPDKYSIRVLIDNNLDGIWSPGNLLKDIPPEDIYIYPEETAVRENWVLTIDISF